MLIAPVILAVLLPASLGFVGWPGLGIPSSAATTAGSRAVHPRWSWPLTPAPARVVVPFAAPAQPYGPGHRGVDLASAGDDVVHAPADGIVAFRGVVVDRGILTIDQGDGLVTTFEPIDSDLSPGTGIRRGDVVGRVAAGGHAVPGTLHFGVRQDGAYINPLLLLGGVPRAVLLPCCGQPPRRLMPEGAPADTP